MEGSAYNWWLRSPYIAINNGGNNFWNVNSNGNGNNNNANNSYGVVSGLKDETSNLRAKPYPLIPFKEERTSLVARKK